MKQLLFVYGSLKRGFRHHCELAGAEFVCAAKTVAGYALVRYGDYPALVARGHDRVSGELFAVDEQLLARIDRFEDVPSLYLRGRLELDDGTPALAYFAARPGDYPLIAGGIWLAG